MQPAGPLDQVGRRTRRVVVGSASILLVLVVYMLVRLAAGDAAAALVSPDIGVTYSAILLLSLAVAVGRAVLVREERLPWALVALGVASWTAGEVVRAAAYGATGTPPTPSPSDP